MGTEAYDMLGRTSERITVSRPLNNGVISDFSMAELLISHYLKQVSGSRMFMPRVVVSVPCGITEVEKRAVVDAITAAGVRKVCLIEEPVAAAIGAGVDIAEPHGTMIVDIGEGATDMAVISLNGIAIANSTHIAGANFNDAIIKICAEEIQPGHRRPDGRGGQDRHWLRLPSEEAGHLYPEGPPRHERPAGDHGDELRRDDRGPHRAGHRHCAHGAGHPGGDPAGAAGGHLHRRHLPHRRLGQPVWVLHPALEKDQDPGGHLRQPGELRGAGGREGHQVHRQDRQPHPRETEPPWWRIPEQQRAKKSPGIGSGGLFCMAVTSWPWRGPGPGRPGCRRCSRCPRRGG